MLLRHQTVARVTLAVACAIPIGARSQRRSRDALASHAAARTAWPTAQGGVQPCRIPASKQRSTREKDWRSGSHSRARSGLSLPPPPPLAAWAPPPPPPARRWSSRTWSSSTTARTVSANSSFSRPDGGEEAGCGSDASQRAADRKASASMCSSVVATAPRKEAAAAPSPLAGRAATGWCLTRTWMAAAAWKQTTALQRGCSPAGTAASTREHSAGRGNSSDTQCSESASAIKRVRKAQLAPRATWSKPAAVPSQPSPARLPAPEESGLPSREASHPARPGPSATSPSPERRDGEPLGADASALPTRSSSNTRPSPSETSGKRDARTAAGAGGGRAACSLARVAPESP
mmetsp:Transcript_21508/g.69795  ORF Transcript_21508/g.69795 Transcript_21508/m.69795 type:complete len:348 (+) Transcript_21508:360-1403(+)